ncbi:hypothetical protein [Vibrio owensii]|uniref:hypothetical protein n=1 Tax=Vibrio owensii TaxID=696485 RepID=UPI003CC60CF5
MQFQCFSIEPATMAQSTGYRACSLAQKGLLLEILSYIWSTEKQFTCPIPEDFAGKLGTTDLELEDLFSLLSNEGLLDKQLCLELGDLVLHSQALEKSYKSQHMQLLRDKQVTDRMLKSQKDSNSLFESLNDSRKGHEYAMGYLAPEERDISIFTGWMPTNRFDVNGQIYYVRTFFKEMLVNEFPVVDIQAELEKIFRYLCDHPERRKNMAYMNSFIRIWMSNAANPRTSTVAQKPTVEEQVSSIESELDKLIALEDAS